MSKCVNVLSLSKIFHDKISSLLFKIDPVKEDPETQLKQICYNFFDGSPVALRFIEYSEEIDSSTSDGKSRIKDLVRRLDQRKERVIIMWSLEDMVKTDESLYFWWVNRFRSVKSFDSSKVEKLIELYHNVRSEISPNVCPHVFLWDENKVDHKVYHDIRLELLNNNIPSSHIGKLTPETFTEKICPLLKSFQSNF